jgi:lauroyl/myristoyl acyltransferase
MTTIQNVLNLRFEIYLGFGNWDLGGHYLVRFAGGKKVNVIADSLSGGYGRFVKHTREKLGVTVIDSTKEIKKAYQALKNGEIVVTVYDRPLKGEPNMSIGSVPVRFPEGVTRMAFETGAACIFGAAYRDPLSQTHAFTEELFNPTVLKMDKKQLMQKLSESFWKLIQQYPDQWYIFRKLQS